MEKKQFAVCSGTDRENITVTFLDAGKPAPLVVYPGVEEEMEKLVTMLPCSVVFITGMDWNRDLSPWPAEAVYRSGEDFAGGADGFLQVILRDILPQVEAELAYPPLFRILAGYSMAGLFAVYAGFQTDAFRGIVSGSGSLWYPGILEFAQSHCLNAAVQAVDLSVGDKEKKTRNRAMASVESNTQTLASCFSKSGIPVSFVKNPGNHFQQVEERMAAGILRILEVLS